MITVFFSNGEERSIVETQSVDTTLREIEVWRSFQQLTKPGNDDEESSAVTQYPPQTGLIKTVLY